MAHVSELPCDGDGVCMLCEKAPPDEEKLACKTCASPWHVSCLSQPPKTLTSTLHWDCPDCSPAPETIANLLPVTAGNGNSGGLVAAVRAIEANEALTEIEKAKKRQELMSGCAKSTADADLEKGKKKENIEVLDVLGETFSCSFCMMLPERPVTTPCGHNFCLKCFQKWIGQGKRTCAKCRADIPSKIASQPRINSALVVAIRMAKTARPIASDMPNKVYHPMHNQNRPDKAFTTERAKRGGKANACSGKIFVTVPPDHFGPILADSDPERHQGVLVGESWEDRMECRQWGAHFPHVAGIAGQSDYGAQSVALSGGYQDDEDHGEWFLYTGSGGRDLSGNKRTSKEQSFDQKFEKLNEALRVSCKKGYPLRVVRSHKEKRSAYAPESGVRYDGIYRIEKCWRKVGIQGYKVCRYLFVRCDNEPAPWTSDEHGDRPRPLPIIEELRKATDVTERKESPAWDYDEKYGWRWTKSPPSSRKGMEAGNLEERKRARNGLRRGQKTSVRERLLKEFSCLICRKVMTLPHTTPCAHNFCKACLEAAFVGQKFVRERSLAGGRTLRAQKTVMKCPSCPNDISEFLKNPQVNRDMMDVIESLQCQSMVEMEEPSGGGSEPTDDKKPEVEMDDADYESVPEESVIPDGGLKDKADPTSSTVESQSPLKGKRKKTETGSCSANKEVKNTVTESGETDQVQKLGEDYPSSAFSCSVGC